MALRPNSSSLLASVAARSKLVPATSALPLTVDRRRPPPGPSLHPNSASSGQRPPGRPLHSHASSTREQPAADPGSHSIDSGRVRRTVGPTTAQMRLSCLGQDVRFSSHWPTRSCTLGQHCRRLEEFGMELVEGHEQRSPRAWLGYSRCQRALMRPATGGRCPPAQAVRPTVATSLYIAAPMHWTTPATWCATSPPLLQRDCLGRLRPTS